MRVHDTAADSGDCVRRDASLARQRAARVGVEREVVGRLRARVAGERRGADHRRVVDAQRGRQQAEPRAARARKLARARARSAPLAATPPTIASVVAARWRRARASARSASWRDDRRLVARGQVGARLGERRRRARARARRSAVLRPENERSWPPCPRRTRGNGKRSRIALARERARAPAPPASLRPSSRAPLSNASPAASSRVPPRRDGRAA